MRSEAQKKADRKYAKEHLTVVSCKLRKEEADELRVYAESHGLTLANFARLALRYCKNNNINLQQEPEEENSEK